MSLHLTLVKFNRAAILDGIGRHPVPTSARLLVMLNADGKKIKLVAIGQSIRSNVCAVKFYYQIENEGMDATMPHWVIPATSWEQMQATVAAFNEQ